MQQAGHPGSGRRGDNACPEQVVGARIRSSVQGSARLENASARIATAPLDLGARMARILKG